MKEWNILVDYIDFYIYDNDLEAVIINGSPETEKAQKVYSDFLEKYNINKNSSLKWSFDIALDCIRNLVDDDRQYLKENCDIDFFGYGLFVRNKYIHCSRVHSYWSADNQCSQVLGFIYTIMHPEYNLFEQK
jgi:hypothetical protein